MSLTLWVARYGTPIDAPYTPGRSSVKITRWAFFLAKTGSKTGTLYISGTWNGQAFRQELNREYRTTTVDGAVFGGMIPVVTHLSETDVFSAIAATAMFNERTCNALIFSQAWVHGVLERLQANAAGQRYWALTRNFLELQLHDYRPTPGSDIAKGKWDIVGCRCPGCSVPARTQCFFPFYNDKVGY